MAAIKLVTRHNGTVTNATAAILRSKGLSVKNGTPVTEVIPVATEAGHTVTVQSVFDLTERQRNSLFTSAKKARAKTAAKRDKAKASK